VTAAGTWIGSKPSSTVNCGFIVRRTYRRSAETTGVADIVTPLGKLWTIGTKATACPREAGARRATIPTAKNHVLRDDMSRSPFRCGPTILTSP
jgi:hypothetical protein